MPSTLTISIGILSVESTITNPPLSQLAVAGRAKVSVMENFDGDSCVICVSIAQGWSAKALRLGFFKEKKREHQV